MIINPEMEVNVASYEHTSSSVARGTAPRFFHVRPRRFRHSSIALLSFFRFFFIPDIKRRRAAHVTRANDFAVSTIKRARRLLSGELKCERRSDISFFFARGSPPLYRGDYSVLRPFQWTSLSFLFSFTRTLQLRS